MALFSGTEVLGVTAEQIGTPTGMLGIPEFGTNFVRGMVEETHPTTFRGVTSALWSVSRYRRVVGKCPRLDQGGHCRSIDRYRVSGRHHGLPHARGSQA